jgi:hypothetical protein
MDLQLPPRKKTTNTSFNTKPDAVRLWVDELPLINPEKSRELLEDALTQINSLSISTSNRYEILELLATSVICVAEAMKKVFLAKPLPLLGNNLLLATQTVALCNQMATGYRILADDAGHDDNQRFYLVLAIHRSLRYLSEVLLTNYQIYNQYPEGVWKTINSLYTLAEQHEISVQPVTDTTLSTPAPSTISTVYKQILLMSLACPYRLRQKEIHFVYNALMDWADITRLYSMEDEQTPGLFAISLNADNPPAYRILSDNNARGYQWRTLDTTPMANRIRGLLDKQPGNRHIGVGDTNILQRLMLAWGVMPKRKFPRRPKSATVGLLVGLNAIHRCVTGPDSASDGRDDTIGDQHYLQDPTFEASTTFKINPFANAGRRIVTSGENRARTSRDEHSTDTGLIESWKMVNYSAGGYSLLWNSDDSSNAKVGELVAIIEQDTHNGDNWQLGVVRWMKCTTSSGLELGIQMLSPSALAVWAYVDESETRSGRKMQGILLPEIKMLSQQTSLLLPTLPFRAGCNATLLAAGSMQNIKLTRQLENTGSFAQYHFSTAIYD